MADKKAPADGWPVISGDYIVGDPESPVAVTTLASHIEAELSGAAIAGSYDMTAILKNVVATGFIAVLFIMCTMAIQHPFNACLGPNEDQVRTLKCAASTAFLSMTLTGLMSLTTGGIGWFVVFIVGLIGWIVSFRAFVLASCNDAASTKWAGLWPKVEQ